MKIFQKRRVAVEFSKLIHLGRKKRFLVVILWGFFPSVVLLNTRMEYIYYD